MNYGILPQLDKCGVLLTSCRDPRFIRKFKKEYCVEAFTEHVVTKKVRKLWRRKDDVFEYPYKEKKGIGAV